MRCKQRLFFLFVLFFLWDVSVFAFSEGLQPPNRDASTERPTDIRTIQWAGRSWRVRPWPGNPGPNNWCDTEDCVWVDANGALHLTIRHKNGKWYASEVNTSDYSNFGEHRFFVEGPLDALDPNVVLGLFLYSGVEDDDIEELDVEFAAWGDTDPAADDGWYTTWYQNAIGDQYSFDVALNGSYTTHAIDWAAARVDFESLHGFYDAPPNPDAVIAQWSTSNLNVIPAPEDEMRIHMNLWLMQGNPPTDGQEVEIIIHDLKAPPEVPKNVSASDGNFSDRVSVVWDALSTAEAYKVFRSESETGTKTLLGSSPDAPFDDRTATPDLAYVYWVVGVNDQGESLFSVSDTGRRAIPLHVTPELLGQTDVQLQWQHQDAACHYEVHRASTPYFDPTSSTLSATLDAPASTYTFIDDAGDLDANYFYQIRAIGCASDLPSPSNRTGEFDFDLSPGQ